MLRVLMATVAVMALVVPAAAYYIVWDGTANGDFTIELQIDCYIQIDRQDSEIHFTDQSPFDWWSTQLQGLVLTRCPDDDSQHPMYAWAGDQWYAGAGGRFYESDDGAVIYVASNNELTMNVTTHGDLTGTINGPPFATIPTWFTLAFCPFTIGGTAVSGHTVYFCGHPGCYLSDGDGDFVFDICDPTYDGPNQYPFPCAGSNTWTTGIMAPQIYGTMKFLARIERHGMADPGDHYQTYVDVNFTSP